MALLVKNTSAMLELNADLLLANVVVTSGFALYSRHIIAIQVDKFPVFVVWPGISCHLCCVLLA